MKLTDTSLLYIFLIGQTATCLSCPVGLDGAVVTQDFPLFKVNTKVMLPQFLNIVIQSPQFIKICQTTSIGTSNRRRLKVDKFLKSRIPLPNIDEQSKFLERINSINQKIDLLKREIDSLNSEMNIGVSTVWGVKANEYQVENENLSMAAEP